MKHTLATALLRCMLGLALVGGIAVTATPALAQPRKDPNKNAELKKRIRVMRAYTLTEELQLDDATTGRLFPLLARYDDITDQLLEQRADLQRQLKNPPPDPRVINRVIDDSIANQHALWETQDKRLAELRKILSPQQVAHLLIVLPQLEKRLENQLRAAANGGGGGGKGMKLGGRRAVDDPFSDDGPVRGGPPGSSHVQAPPTTQGGDLKDPFRE